jgi:Glyoxalase-like domain
VRTWRPGPITAADTRKDACMEILRRVVVFDAADLAAESGFWAGMLDGRVFTDDTWHSVFDADGRWVIGIQLAPDHVPPDWPDGNPQQVHLDLHVDDPAGANAKAIELGARLLQAADDLTAPEGHQVYADPAGHPFCLGWGHPDDDAIRRFLHDHC